MGPNGPLSTPAHPDQPLRDALTASQQLGFLGDRPIEQVIEHARAFVDVLPREPVSAGGADSVVHVLDLGSGGGVPGLVIAHDRPDVRLILLDRRSKRTDFLRRVVSRLGWADRVTVVCADADAFMSPVPLDAVVARGFGPPTTTLATAVRLVRPGGWIVISEPPDADRWPTELLRELSVDRRSEPGAAMAVFRSR